MEQQSFPVDVRRHSVAWLFAGVIGSTSLQEEFLLWTEWPASYQDKIRAVTIWDELTRHEMGDLNVLLLVRGLDPSPSNDDDARYRETLMTNLDTFERNLSDHRHRLLLHLAQEFVHENYRELEMNLWIVKPVGVYVATLITNSYFLCCHTHENS